jgi:hypothetical protein
MEGLWPLADTDIQAPDFIVSLAVFKFVASLDPQHPV